MIRCTNIFELDVLSFTSKIISHSILFILTLPKTKKLFRIFQLSFYFSQIRLYFLSLQFHFFPRITKINLSFYAFRSNFPFLNKKLPYSFLFRHLFQTSNDLLYPTPYRNEHFTAHRVSKVSNKKTDKRSQISSQTFAKTKIKMSLLVL
jgi:hypothetical protein